MFQQKEICFGGESYNMNTSQHQGLKPAEVSVVTRQSAGTGVQVTKAITEGAEHCGKLNVKSCLDSFVLVWFLNFNTKSIFLMGA